MLDAIASLQHVTKLEINGNSKWAYDPVLLNNLERLQELRIILPDRKVAESLKTLLQLRSACSTGDTAATGKRGLQVLELISQDSRWINDQLMDDIAPYLVNLRVFKLWGCAHIGPRGYLQVIRSAQDALEELGLEGVGWVSRQKCKEIQGFERSLIMYAALAGRRTRSVGRRLVPRA
jgi:hypothetical protein